MPRVHRYSQKGQLKRKANRHKNIISRSPGSFLMVAANSDHEDATPVAVNKVLQGVARDKRLLSFAGHYGRGVSLARPTRRKAESYGRNDVGEAIDTESSLSCGPTKDILMWTTQV